MRPALLICFLLHTVLVFAGNGNSDIMCRFEKSILSPGPDNPLPANMLYMENNGQDSISVRIASADPAVRIFNAGTIILAPRSSAQQVLKFSLPGNRLYSGYSAGIWCISNKADSIYVSFTLSLPAKRDVQLYSSEPSPFINNDDLRDNIPLVVRNKGNIPELLHLHITGAADLPDLPLQLGPYTDTSFSLACRYMLQGTQPRPVVIALLDSSDRILSVAEIHPRIVRNVLTSGCATTPQADNYASVLYTTNSTNRSYREYQLSYNRNGTANGLILAGYAFDGSGVPVPNISNSYIGYRKDRFSMRAGLLNLRGELPVYGQGGSVTLGDSRRFISASYLHNGDASLNNETQGPRNETKNAQASFGYDLTDRLQAGGLLLHQWHNRFNKDIYLGGLSLRWITGKNGVLETALYGNSGTTAIGQAQGGAGHLRWSGSNKRWQFFSDNYLSSPDYAGLLRNTKQFSESITWRTAAKETAAGILFTGNYLHSDPAFYDDKLQRISNLQVNEQYGIGFFKNFSRLLLRLYPYYGRQQALLGKDLYTLQNYYTRIDAQYSHKKLSASINLTTGIQQKQDGITTAMLPVRAQLFLQYKYFTLQGVYQYRPFYATDLMRETISGKIFSLAGLGPGVRTSLLHNCLEVYANYNLQYFNGNTTPMQYVFAGATATIHSNWQFITAYSCTIGNYYTYQDLRLGIKFLFGNPGSILARRRSMIFYSDDNHNGKKDQGEKNIPGVLVGLPPSIARSDAGGSIKLKQCKTDFGGLSLIDGHGYMPARDISTIKNEHKRIYVPMYLMGVVSGKLKLLLPKYSRQAVTVTGLPLVFTDEGGNTTLCYIQADGSFSISLPAGHYTISIAQELADMYRLEPTPPIEVNGKKAQPLQLGVKYSHAQPVETIQFSGKR